MTILKAPVFNDYFSLTFFKTKKKALEEEDNKKYDTFVDTIGSELNKVKAFTVEDFRHFRENPKLQDCLKRLYDVYLYGEKEGSNYFLILRKFDKGTTERNAVEYLVTFTDKLREQNIEQIEAYVKDLTLRKEAEQSESSQKHI